LAFLDDVEEALEGLEDVNKIVTPSQAQASFSLAIFVSLVCNGYHE